MKTRREFLYAGVMAGAALAVSPRLIGASETKLTKFGFISGLIKKEIEANWKDALKAAAALGYGEYEGSVQGDSPEAFHAYCKSIGLTPICGGIAFNDEESAMRTRLEALARAEMRYAIAYWPWRTGGPFPLEACQESCERLNLIGAMAKEYGLKLCWHNHDVEFEPMEEGLPFDYFMARTDAELVACEMDVYWVMKGGGDPVSLLQRYPQRIPLLHLKDMVSESDASMCCPGEGFIDFPEILRVGARNGVRHGFVERDNASNGMACLETSIQYLRTI